MNLSKIRCILRERKLAPNPRYGQNFLHDENLARRIVDSSGAFAGSRVLEIGPGLGALTRFFLDAGAEVTAIEIDNGLADFLEEYFQGAKMNIIRGDAVKILKNITGEFNIIAGNLPYSVAVPIIIQTAIYCPGCSRCIWMVQREIANRMAAAAATPLYGSVSVVVQNFYRIVSRHQVGTTVFYPEPAVQSTVITLHANSMVNDIFKDKNIRADFSIFVRTAFAARRKMLGNTLRKFPDWDESLLAKAQICGRKRPEHIQPESWIRLFIEFQKNKKILCAGQINL